LSNTFLRDLAVHTWYPLPYPTFYLDQRVEDCMTPVDSIRVETIPGLEKGRRPAGWRLGSMFPAMNHYPKWLLT
jgi:hypothetical protein